MGADISALGNLEPLKKLDLGNYADNKDYVPLPPAGEYILRAPDSFSFAKTNAGALSAQIDPEIVGPTNTGYKIRFTKVSAKQWERGGKVVSQVGDYLRACGNNDELGEDPQETADAVVATANTTYRAELDWRAYNPKTKYTLEGMQRFKSDGNGGYIPYVFDPVDTDDEGNPKRLPARLVVKRFVPVTND